MQAIVTTDQAVRPLVGASGNAATLWSRALSESYRTELRAEKPERARLIVAAELERYRRVTAVLASRPLVGTGTAASRRWFWRRVQGKTLSLLRFGEGVLDLRRRCGLPGLEDQPTRGHSSRIHRLGTAPSAAAAPFVLWRLARRGAIR